jgi:hypothetical protein
MISTFWLSDLRLDRPDMPINEAIEHYLRLLAGVFVPYATDRGMKDIEGIARRGATRGTARARPQPGSG